MGRGVWESWERSCRDKHEPVGSSKWCSEWLLGWGYSGLWAPKPLERKGHAVNATKVLVSKSRV